MEGRQVQLLEPDELVNPSAQSDLRARGGRCTRGDPSQPAKPVARPRGRRRCPRSALPHTGPGGAGAVRPPAGAVAFLLERCGDEASRDRVIGRHARPLPPVASRSSRSTSTCSTWSTSAAAVTPSTAPPRNGSILVDKELYGDTFRRPARCFVAAGGEGAGARARRSAARTSRGPQSAGRPWCRPPWSVRGSGRGPSHRRCRSQRGGGDGVVGRRTPGKRRRWGSGAWWAGIGYHSRSSEQGSQRRVIFSLTAARRDQRGWYVEASTRSKDGRRTFKVSRRSGDAELPMGRALRAARGDGRPAPAELGGEVGTARVLLRWPERASL